MKNFKRNIISLILASSLVSACSYDLEKEEDVTHFNSILETNQDNVLLDEYLDLNGDNKLINKVDDIEDKIDKYYEEDIPESKKVSIAKKVGKDELEDVYKLCDYVLVSSLCSNLNLDINVEHEYKYAYKSELDAYLLTFDNSIYVVRNNNHTNDYYDILRYMAIFDTYNLLGNDKMNVINNCLDVCKGIIEKETIIENNNIYTLKSNVRKLIK